MPVQYLTVPERNARKNECVRGHPFSKENTAWFKNPTHGGMMRQCRQCGIDRKRAARAAQGAKPRVAKPKRLTKVQQEREIIANKAREYAGHYPEASDGRNTFILFGRVDRGPQ